MCDRRTFCHPLITNRRFMKEAYYEWKMTDKRRALVTPLLRPQANDRRVLVKVRPNRWKVKRELWGMSELIKPKPIPRQQERPLRAFFFCREFLVDIFIITSFLIT